jgi:hypothetical protein
LSKERWTLSTEQNLWQKYGYLLNKLRLQKCGCLQNELPSQDGICLTFVSPCIIVKCIKKDPTRCNNVLNFIIPYLYEAQRVSGDTPPNIRSLKLHWQPLIFHTWKVQCAWQHVELHINME